MINAAAADAHRFGQVKRNGYDPAEVDAVVARLVDDLRAYETKTAKLEERLAEADASADAIRRTFIVAEQTKDEIVSGAREQATTITDAARAESEDLLIVARRQSAEITANAEEEAQATADIASRLEQEIAARRSEMLTEASGAAEAVMTAAESEAASRAAAAIEESNAIRQNRIEEEDTALRRTSLAVRYTMLAIAWSRSVAVANTAKRVADAEVEARAIVADARQDTSELHERTAALRAAVAGLERSARNLAEMTAEEAAVIDLSQIEAVEAKSGPRTEPLREIKEPVATEPSRPLLSVAEATAELERQDDDEDVEEALVEDTPPEAPTYYQRSTGTPLSERVKIAKKSG